MHDARFSLANGLVLFCVIVNVVLALAVTGRVNLIQAQLGQLSRQMTELHAVPVVTPDLGHDVGMEFPSSAPSIAYPRPETGGSTWAHYPDIVGTLTFDIPKTFFVEQGNSDEEAWFSIKSNPYRQIFYGGIGCDDFTACVDDLNAGLQIRINPKKVEVKGLRTVYPNIEELLTSCDSAEGPCGTPAKTYVFRGRTKDYLIEVDQKGYQGDWNKIVNLFLASLKEAAR